MVTSNKAARAAAKNAERETAKAARLAAAKLKADERQRSSDAKIGARKAERQKAHDTAVAEVQRIGKEIAVRVEKVRKYESVAEEKARVEIKNAQDHRDAIGKLLTEARAKCKAAGMDFKAFQAEYCPDFGRTKLYQLLQIGSGATTSAEEREKKRLAKAAERAANKASATTPPVADTPRSTGNGSDPAIAADIRMAQSGNGDARKRLLHAGYKETIHGDGKVPTFAAPEEPGVPEPVAEPPGATPWDQFKTTCDKLLPLLNTLTRAEARKYVTAVTGKLDAEERRKAA